MKALIVALLGGLGCAGAAFAADDPCAVARHLVSAEAALPRVAAAIEQQHIVRVVVLGTSSSALPGLAGSKAAYPARLEAALAAHWPGIAVKVVAAVKPRKTAIEMIDADFERMVMDEKPALVVWQTGTVDAIRGVDPDEFREALVVGIEMLQAKGADVILMNMQYSPRTESLIPADALADTMRWAAVEREVPLFDRLAIMKHWTETGTFDLYDAGKGTGTAERVHDCLGRLLAELVVEAAKAGGTAGEVH